MHFASPTSALYIARLEEPSTEKDAPVGSGERVVLPFGQVVFIIKPLVHLRARERRVRLELGWSIT